MVKKTFVFLQRLLKQSLLITAAWQVHCIYDVFLSKIILTGLFKYLCFWRHLVARECAYFNNSFSTNKVQFFYFKMKSAPFSWKKNPVYKICKYFLFHKFNCWTQDVSQPYFIVKSVFSGCALDDWLFPHNTSWIWTSWLQICCNVTNHTHKLSPKNLNFNEHSAQTYNCRTQEKTFWVEGVVRHSLAKEKAYRYTINQN